MDGLPLWAVNRDASDQRVFNSATIAIVAGAVRFICSILAALVLARLLTPEDFGLVGMALPLIALVSVFSDGGVSQHILQLRQLSHASMSLTFWLGAIVSCFLFVILIAFIPFVADFYDEPRLSTICIVLAFSLLLNIFTAQHNSLAKKCFRQDLYASAEVVGSVMGLLAGIMTALNGGGYWALVVMPLVRQAFHACVIWARTRWVPAMIKIEWYKSREVLRFGMFASMASVIVVLGQHADKVIIGATLGPTELGYYTMAYSLMAVPFIQILGPVGGVMVPYFNQSIDDADSLNAALCKSVAGLGGLIGPLMCWAAYHSEALVGLALGEQWSPSVLVFSYLALASIPLALYIPSTWVLAAFGRPGKHALWSGLAMIPMLFAFIIGVQWGVAGVAKCYLVAMLSLLITCPFFVARYTSMSARAYAAVVLKILFLSGVSVTFVMIADRMIFPNSWNVLMHLGTTLMVLIVVAAPVFLLLFGGLFRRQT